MARTDDIDARPRAGRSDPHRAADVAAARRGVASFGLGDQPSVSDTLRRFVRRYGWRAYALPILAVVTLVALLTARSQSPTHPSANQPAAGGGGAAAASSPPVATGTMPLKSDRPAGKSYQKALTVGALPKGKPYTRAGDGTFRVLKTPPGGAAVIGHAANGGQPLRYDVEVERGITGIDVHEFSSMVQSVLSDKRSWTGHGVALQRVDSGPIDFHISLTSSMTVRKLCGYDVPVETSCYARAGGASDVNRVVINDARWVRGAGPYVGDLHAYRIYMINHEDGHALGHMHAHQCLPGGLAPVMMQQTFGLRSAATGQLCQANPWPYPPGVKGAPGAEQPDTPQNDEYSLGD